MDEEILFEVHEDEEGGYWARGSNSTATYIFFTEAETIADLHHECVSSIEGCGFSSSLIKIKMVEIREGVQDVRIRSLRF